MFRSLIRCIGKVDVNNILEETGCPLSANTIKVLSEVGFEPTPPERLRPAVPYQKIMAEVGFEPTPLRETGA